MSLEDIEQEMRDREEEILLKMKPQLYALRQLGKRMGEMVKTKDGHGILIGFGCPHNGLYFEPERGQVTVWYGTQWAQSGWVSKQYDIGDILD